MRNRAGTSAINRRKFVAKAKQTTPIPASTPTSTPATAAAVASSTTVPASTSVSTAGIAVVAPGAQDRIDGKEPQSTNLFGGEIKVDEEGRMDLSEIEKMDPLTAGARGTVVPTEQFVGMGKDVVYGVDSKNQKHMESGLDLLINPLIKPFMDPRMRSEGVIKDQWYWPEELKANWNVLPEFMQKGGEGKPPETRSFVEGMSGVVGNIGAIVQSPVAGKIAGDELGVSVERFTRSPSTTAYYIGSALGEIPYFIVGGGTVKAVATISAKATAGVMKGTVKGTAGLALVARTYKIERALDAAAKSTVKSNISAAKTGTITGKKSIIKAVEQIKKGYRDNIIKQKSELDNLPQDQRALASDLSIDATRDSKSLGDRFSANRIDRINKMPTSTKAEEIEKVRLAQEFVSEVETILLPQLRTFKTTYLGLTSSMIKGGRIERLANVIQGSPVDVKAKLDRFLNPPGRTQGDIAKTPDLKYGYFDGKGKWYVPEPDSGINAENVFKQNIHDTVEANWKAGKYEGVLGNIKINKDLFGNVVSSALGVNRARARAKDLSERFSKAVPVNIIIPGDAAAKAFQQVDDKMTELKIEKTQLEAAKKEALEYADYKTVDTPDGAVFAYASDAMDTNILNNEVKINKLQEKINVFKNEYNTKISSNREKIKTLDEIVSTGKFKVKQVDGSFRLDDADKMKITETKLLIKELKSDITNWNKEVKTNVGYSESLKEIKELKSQNKKWKKDSKTKVEFRQQDPNMMSLDDLDKRLAVVDSKINELPTNLRKKIFTDVSYTKPGGPKTNRGKEKSREWTGATGLGYNPDFERGTLWRMDVLELNRMFPGFGDMVASQTIHVAVKPAVSMKKEKGLWKGTWGGDGTKLDLTPDQRKTLGLKDGEDRVINDPGGDIWIVNESRKDVLKTMDAKYLPPSKKIKKVGLKKVKLPLVGKVKTLLPWKADEKVSMVYMLQGTDVLKASAGADPRSGVRPLIQFAAGTSDDTLEPFKAMGYFKVADSLPKTMKAALGDKITLEYRGLSKADLDKVVGPDAMIKAEKNRKDWQYALDKAIGQNPDGSDYAKLDKAWQGRDPIELASIQVDGGQKFSKSVPIIDILKQRALIEGNINSVIGYAKDKDLLFEDQLRYLNYKKKFAEQPLGGWTDTADVTILKQEAKIKLDVKEIEQEIKEVKQQKELNLKYTDRKLLKKGEGIHLGSTRQGTVSYMSEYRMNQFASQYDQSATPENFLRDSKTGESYFMSESGVFRILDPENYDPSMTTPGRKVPVDSMSGGGTRMSQMRNELIDPGAEEPYVQPITGSIMVDTPPGKPPMYRDMPGIAPAYANQDDMIVWTSSGQIKPNIHFKMTPSDRSVFADIMGKKISLDEKLELGDPLDVKLSIPRTEYEGIDAKLTRRMVSLDEPDSWKGILEMVSLDDVGIMKYGKGWKFVKAQQERLANAPDYSATGSGVWNFVQKQKDNININLTKRIGGTLESVTEKKQRISEFFTGERFQKIDMRNLNPSQGLGSMEKLDFIEGMLGLGDGVRHAGYDYFKLARLQGVSKDSGSIKQGEPVGGFIAHPIGEIQDLGYIQKEKVMSDPPRDPTLADKRSNYKILEDAVIRDTGLEANSKNESFMQFKRNMVELVYKKIKNQDIGKAEVKKIASDDSRYKAVVLKEIDTPGNKKLRYPKTGEKVYNKKDKGFIHPGVDLPPKYRSVIPKPEPIGTKTIRQFREQMTPVRPAFGKSFEPVDYAFLPGKLPNIVNMWLRRNLENPPSLFNWSGVTPVTTEASSSHYNTALRSVLSEIESIDPKLLGKKGKAQLDELRSHPNIAWDENMKKLEDWQRTEVGDLKRKHDESKIKLDSIDRNIRNEKSRLDDLVNLKGEKRITTQEAAKEFKSYKKVQEQRRIKYRKEVEKYDMEGRELRQRFTAIDTPYVTAHMTLVQTTEGGVPGFKWLTTGDDPDLIIQPAPNRVGSQGKDINPPPLTYPETRALVEGMVYKSLGITEETFNTASSSVVRSSNRAIDWNLQEGFTKSQAKTNLRSPDDFAKWLKSLDTTGDKNTPKLGDTSKDVVDSLQFKRIIDTKSSATENLQKMEKTKNMEKEKLKTAPTFSPSLMDERITKSLAKDKEVGLMSQLKLGLRSSPAITTMPQTEGFDLLPGVDAEPMMVIPQPKNIVDQTISDIQKTMSGIEIGSGKIGDTKGQTLKTYIAPSSLTGISANTILSSMSTIDTSRAQVPGFVMDISSGLKLDASTGQEVIPMFMRFLRTPQEQAQRQVQSFVTPQLYPIKPLMVQATAQVPPITKPPITNILPIVPVIPKFPAQGRPFKYTRVRKRVRHKKTWWQTPANWYEPYYWGGKNQEGPGYVTFKGREPGKVRKYEKKYFGIGVGDTPFGIKGSWF
jgi:hypothetical protein